MIKRDKRNIGKEVIYISGTRKGRITKITGFRGDWDKGIPNVTLTDGNSVPAFVLEFVKKEKI